MNPDLVVLFEHPEWQKPLFNALERRGVHFRPFDLKRASYNIDAAIQASLYFNQASPSAYMRGHARAVPFALSLMRSLELRGARVLNGSTAFSLELSKSMQGTLMHRLGIAHPVTMVFNEVEAVMDLWDHWPALLKPEQGGSGARMYLLHSKDELVRLLRDRPELWQPDNLLLIQEYFEVDPSQGIVRMEFVGSQLLYAMRVVSHGAFNLCPSELCNPNGGEASICELPKPGTTKPIEFFPYKEVPLHAVETGKLLMREGKLDIGGIEYLESQDGRLIFYDINANSNLRPAIAKEFGFDPFERVVDYLITQIFIS